MSTSEATPFTPRGTQGEIEHGLQFQPKFDSSGLIPAIVTDGAGGEVLMFAHMNAEALKLSLERGVAHFWSRSRARIWKKGEESGNLLRIAELLVDCDQDVLWLKVSIEGAGVACHTGAKSCFYRTVQMGGAAMWPVTLQTR